MATIRQIRDNFKALDLDKLVMDTIMDHKQDITDLNRKQLKYGRKSDGERVGKYRSREYKLMKIDMNPLAGGYVDLTLTGDFTNMLTLRRDSDKVAEIFSEDEKATMLKAKYGDDIYGLTDGSVGELITKTTFVPDLVKRIKISIKLQ